MSGTRSRSRWRAGYLNPLAWPTGGNCEDAHEEHIGEVQRDRSSARRCRSGETGNHRTIALAPRKAARSRVRQINAYRVGRQPPVNFLMAVGWQAAHERGWGHFAVSCQSGMHPNCRHSIATTAIPEAAIHSGQNATTASRWKADPLCLGTAGRNAAVPDGLWRMWLLPESPSLLDAPAMTKCEQLLADFVLPSPAGALNVLPMRLIALEGQKACARQAI